MAGVIRIGLEFLTPLLAHSIFSVSFCIASGQIPEFSKLKRDGDAVIVQIRARVSLWWVEYDTGELIVLNRQFVSFLNFEQVDVVFFNCIEVSVIRCGGVCNTGIVRRSMPSRSVC